MQVLDEAPSVWIQNRVGKKTAHERFLSAVVAKAAQVRGLSLSLHAAFTSGWYCEIFVGNLGDWAIVSRVTNRQVRGRVS